MALSSETEGEETPTAPQPTVTRRPSPFGAAARRLHGPPGTRTASSVRRSGDSLCRAESSRGCGIVGASAFCAAVCRAFAMAITVFEARAAGGPEPRSLSSPLAAAAAACRSWPCRTPCCRSAAPRSPRSSWRTRHVHVPPTRRRPPTSEKPCAVTVVSLHVRCPCPSSMQTWR